MLLYQYQPSQKGRNVDKQFVLQVIALFLCASLPGRQQVIKCCENYKDWMSLQSRINFYPRFITKQTNARYGNETFNYDFHF